MGNKPKQMNIIDDRQPCHLILVAQCHLFVTTGTILDSHTCVSVKELVCLRWLTSTKYPPSSRFGVLRVTLIACVSDWTITHGTFSDLGTEDTKFSASDFGTEAVLGRHWSAITSDDVKAGHNKVGSDDKSSDGS